MVEQSEITRVINIVKSNLSPSFDHESIAMDLLIESWSNGIDHPTYQFIRYRCLDAARESSLESKALTHIGPNFMDSTQEEIENRDQVNLLMQVLSPIEKKLVWYRFYKELPIRECAQALKIPTELARETLKLAIYKMRSAAE